MQRLLVALMITCGTFSGAFAAAPGPLDGQDIPSDFADSKLVGLQTNRTGAGDVTSLDAVVTFSEGSELDGLYLAKDSTFLYVGLGGNLLEVGNAYVILIDNAFDLGQTELQTEGVGGPPFALQLAGREVLVNTNGTSGDGSDDTYTVTPNSGTLLPDCGDGSFTGWDYALAIDSAGGTMFAHEYILFGFQIGIASGADTCHFGDDRGRVACDPTPDNPGDSALPVFTIRNFVAESPLGDGNEIFEAGQAQFGYQRGGFLNTNTTGVTDTSAALADLATTGVEIAIPLANIGDSGLFGTETINMLILTLDADEFQVSPVSDEFGTVINQALPALTGASCDPPQGLGKRPDLSTVASCLTIDLSTLGAIDTGAVLEGVIVASDYDGDAPILSQQCPTSGGDQARDLDIIQPVQDGSELNALYADNDDMFLYLGLTGNLQGGGTSINVFVDADPQASNGDQVISDFSDFMLDGTYEQWTTSNGAVLTSDPDDFRVESTDWGGGFKDISPNLNAAGAVILTLDFTVNAANQADTVRVVLTDADGTERFYDFAVPGIGTHSLSLPLTGFSFEINPGTVPGMDLSDLSFFHIAGGFNNGDPGLPLDVTFDHLALSDADDGEHVLDFNPPSAFETIEIEDFSDFSLFGTYVSWTTATFTSGATDFRVETTGGFGGGFADISPNVNLTRGISIELDLTVNPASATGGVLLVLADNDDTQLRWSWFGLSPGSYTLTANLADGVEVFAGAVPGFDFSNVSFFHLQGDFATTDISFDNLAVNSVLPGAAAIVGMSGNELPNGPLDVLNNGQFVDDAAVQYDFAYGINLDYAPHLAYVDFFDLVSDTFAFRGAIVPDSGDAVLFDTPGGLTAENPNGLQMAFNNQNTTGVVGCGDEEPCFKDSAATVSALAEQATLGMEMAIPLADLGLDVSDLPRVVRVWTTVGSPVGSATDQGLPSMRNATGEGNQVVNPAEAPVNFTNPAGGPSLNVLVSDFSNFALTGTYGVWGTAVFTSGIDDFRIESTDFGGGFFLLDPFVDATGASQMVIDVTLNPANQTDRLIVILFDGDGTVRVYRFAGLSNGTQTLTVDLKDFFQEDAPGSVPGLDLANIGQVNIAGAFHNGNPGMVFDVTFDNLALVGGTRNFEARAARICLGTVAGDADCDGDNDLRDFWLFQECIGVTADPVLPMECEQLDFVKDRVIDDQDVAGLVAILDGP